MRTSKSASIKRASFVIDIFANDPQTSISEVRRKLLAEFKHSMSYALITKYRDAVMKEAKAQAHVSAIPTMNASITAPVTLPNGQPIVSVVSPASPGDHNMGLPTELVEGLKHLVRFGLYQTAKAGVIQISANREGEISVNCLLEQNASQA